MSSPLNPPLLKTPRTPTPPPDDDTLQRPSQPLGLGLGFEGELSTGDSGFDLNALSPLSASLPYKQTATASTECTPTSAANSQPTGAVPSTSGGLETPNPFNFQSVAYQPGKPPIKQNDVGRRRGHKYKHSSVSHQIFLEPAPRAPLQLPASLPIPTFKEYRSSMSKDQKLRLLWCFCHLVVASLVQWCARESLALTVLSRLIFYDALGAFLCVAVDVGSNFEVWKRSSIRHPFGFERLEVIAGLGMSVGLLFMGLDLISHGITHALESSGGHQAHHADAHERVSPGGIDLAALSGIMTTLVSAILLKNHARIGKVMRLSAIANLPSVLSNPSHFLTLSCSTLLLLLPLLSIQMYVWLDRTLSFSVAFAMVALGWIQGWTLGKMLLMSYSGTGVSDVLYDLETDPAISAVEEAKFWQVHYGLCQANLRLRVRSLDEIGRLRDRIRSTVRNRLGGGYGSGGQKWEVSTQITLEKE